MRSGRRRVDMGGRQTDGLDDQTISKAILLAAKAGEYEIAARDVPEAASGLGKMRELFSAKATALLTDYAARAVGSSTGPFGHEE